MVGAVLVPNGVELVRGWFRCVRGAVLVSNGVEPAPWWELEFEMGRRRYDAQFSAAWHALPELFGPIDRALGLVYRLLLRVHGGALRPDNGVQIGPGAARVASETTLEVIPYPASAGTMDSLLRAFVVEIPHLVNRATGMRPASLGHTGPGVAEPLVVLSGVILASVTPASYTVRVKWFLSIDWSRMSRLLRGWSPAPPPLKVSDERSPESLEAFVNRKALEAQHGLERMGRMGRMARRCSRAIRVAYGA